MSRYDGLPYRGNVPPPGAWRVNQDDPQARGLVALFRGAASPGWTAPSTGVDQPVPKWVGAGAYILSGGGSVWTAPATWSGRCTMVAWYRYIDPGDLHALCGWHSTPTTGDGWAWHLSGGWTLVKCPGVADVYPDYAALSADDIVGDVMSYDGTSMRFWRRVNFAGIVTGTTRTPGALAGTPAIACVGNSYVNNPWRGHILRVAFYAHAWDDTHARAALMDPWGIYATT